MTNTLIIDIMAALIEYIYNVCNLDHDLTVSGCRQIQINFLINAANQGCGSGSDPRKKPDPDPTYPTLKKKTGSEPDPQEILNPEGSSRKTDPEKYTYRRKRAGSDPQ